VNAPKLSMLVMSSLAKTPKFSQKFQSEETDEDVFGEEPVRPVNLVEKSILKSSRRKHSMSMDDAKSIIQYVKMRTTLDVVKRSNNNLQFSTDANPAKKLKLMNFKPSDFDIIDFNNDFKYEPKNKKHDFPNWEVYKKNKLSRTHHDKAGKVRVAGTLRSIWVEEASIDPGNCPNCKNTLKKKKIDKLSCEFMDYWILTCIRYVKGPSTKCGYHCLIEVDPNNVEVMDDSDFGFNSLINDLINDKFDK
jgi:hypothetical protein